MSTTGRRWEGLELQVWWAGKALLRDLPKDS